MVNLTLREYMEQQGVTRYKLSTMTDIRYHVIDSYYKNKVVRYDSYVLNRICRALECEIQDILRYTKD